MLQVIFSEHGKILAQQSSHHFYSVLLPSTQTPPLQLGASSSESVSVAVLNFVLLQNLLINSFCQTFPSSINLLLLHTSRFFSFLLCVLPKKYLAVSFISSVDHPFTFFVSCVRITPLLYDMRSCTTNAGAILHDFRLQRTSFHSSLL